MGYNSVTDDTGLSSFV